MYSVRATGGSVFSVCQHLPPKSLASMMEVCLGEGGDAGHLHMEKVSQIYEDGRHLQGGQILHHLYGSGFVTADISDIACLVNFLWDDGVWSGNVLYSAGKFQTVSQESLGSSPKKQAISLGSHFK